MAEWLVEDGIGEERAIRLERDEVVAARLRWPGELSPGQVVEGRLARRHAGTSRGIGELEDGTEILLERLPRDLTEGMPVRIAISRSAIAERGRLKLAQGQPTSDEPRAAPPLAEQLAAEGHEVRTVRRFAGPDWDEVVAEAFEGEIGFAGGQLQLASTPAMVLIDIDGTLPARELALAAVPAIASTLQRLDIGGMVGIDFPTLQAKADRKAVDDALEDALGGWPHERTAMNGFGFVQIVSRLERPSLLHRATHSRSALAARQLLRRTEGVDEPGALLLTAHPATLAMLRPEWIEELARRTGREIRQASNPSLALEAGFAQAVPR